MKIELTRDDRTRIVEALNARLLDVGTRYHASCDRKAPDLALFSEHGRLTCLRELIRTGRTYEQQDDDASRAADRSERFMRA